MSNQKSKITYSDSGVDIDKANDLIDEIKITIAPRIIGGKFTWIPAEQTNKIFNLPCIVYNFWI